jgi:hypothetical protein
MILLSQSTRWVLRWRSTRRLATPEPQLALRLQIELVYDPGCPNVGMARDVLASACRETDIPAVWTEWNSEDEACPPHARNLGSPSILVNGEDVAPGPHPWTPRDPGHGPRCRVYRDGDALVGAPPMARVTSAITTAMGPEVV